MAGTGQGGRFSLSGRYCGAEQGIYPHLHISLLELKMSSNLNPKQSRSLQKSHHTPYLVTCSSAAMYLLRRVHRASFATPGVAEEKTSPTKVIAPPPTRTTTTATTATATATMTEHESSPLSLLALMFRREKKKKKKKKGRSN